MTRSRAALLPHPADPFLLKYWLQYMNNVWGSEIDRLYIYVNSPTEKPVIDYIYSLCQQSKIPVNWQYNNVQTEHGYALDRMLDIVTEEHIVLLEDDCFIFKPGVIDQYFQFVEQDPRNVVGSARGSCSFEISKRAKELWNIEYEGYGDRGPNFWPNLFFCHKSVLLETDRKFGARAWNKGEVIEPLQYTVESDIVVGDTFVSTSLQVRAKNYNIMMIPQYHGSPEDYTDHERQTNLWDGRCPYVHIGSLSSGTHGLLMDDVSRPLAYRTVKEPGNATVLPRYFNTEQERRECERRVQWWRKFIRNFKNSIDVNAATTIDAAVFSFASDYEKAVARIISQYDLNEGRINQRDHIYAKLGL